jgi:hypothetical protein
MKHTSNGDVFKLELSYSELEILVSAMNEFSKTDYQGRHGTASDERISECEKLHEEITEALTGVGV